MTLRLLYDTTSSFEHLAPTRFLIVEETPRNQLVYFSGTDEEILLPMPWVYYQIRIYGSTTRPFGNGSYVERIAARPIPAKDGHAHVYELPVAHQYFEGWCCPAGDIGRNEPCRSLTQKINQVLTRHWQEGWRHHDNISPSIEALMVAAQVPRYSSSAAYASESGHIAWYQWFAASYRYWEAQGPEWAERLGWGRFSLGQLQDWTSSTSFLDTPLEGTHDST